MRTDGQTNGQTDMTKPIVAFGNIANTHKNNNLYEYIILERIEK